MLSCKDITHLASDHIDQNLPFMMKMKVKLHLFLCKDCRNFIKNFQASIKTISKFKSEAPEKIEQQIQILMKASSHINPENMDK